MLNTLTFNKTSSLYPTIRYFSFTCPKPKPGILIDADGVLKRGNIPIPQAKQAIDLLRKYKIPFIVVTNSGGCLESSKAQTISKCLQLTEESPLKPSEMILCHTPMKSILRKMSRSSQSKIPLIFGCGDIHNLMKSYGVNRYITDKEYGTIFSHIFGFNIVAAFLPDKEKTKTLVENRLNMRIDYKKLIGINGILQVTDPLNWEIPMQLCCDLLISKDGIPGTERTKDDACVVEYHLANPDVDFADNFPIPRFGGGSFFFLLQEIFQLKYKFDFPHIPYGKPYKKIYDYAKKRIRKNFPNERIGSYYMIGDNPVTDIKGANSHGLHSILVKTGIFNGTENDTVNIAKTVVDNVLDAINFILVNEHIL